MGIRGDAAFRVWMPCPREGRRPLESNSNKGGARHQHGGAYPWSEKQDSVSREGWKPVRAETVSAPFTTARSPEATRTYIYSCDNLLN
jgi:hypothetical protein